MFRWSVHALLGLVLCTACATTPGKGDNGAHILSGEAPVETVVAKADASFQEGDYEAAAILYQIAVRQDPQADYWYKLGMASTHLANQEAALSAFYQALDVDPEHEGALEKLGLYYTSRGDVERARELLERLRRVNPDNWKAHNSLGVLADLQEDFDGARLHYTDALKLRPDLPILWNNLGYSVYLMGDLELASSYLGRALQLDPAHDAARQNLALIYVRQDRYDDALATFFETKDVATAYTSVGYLAYRVGDYSKATELLEEAIRRSPTYNRAAHSYLAAAREARKTAG